MQAPSPPLSLGLLEEASYAAAEPSFDTQSDPHSDPHSDSRSEPSFDTQSDTHSETQSEAEPTDAICTSAICTSAICTPQRKRPGHPLYSETDTTVHFGNQCPERLVSKLLKTVTDVTQTAQTALQTTQTAQQTALQTAQPNEAQEFRPFVLSHSRSPQQLSGIRCVSCMSRLHGFVDCDLTLCKRCLLFHRPYRNCRESQRQSLRQSRQSLRQSRQSLRQSRPTHDDKNTPFDSQRLLLMQSQPARKEGSTSALILSLEDRTQQERQWCTDTVPEIEINFKNQNRFFHKKHWKKKKNKGYKGYRKWR